MPLGRRWLHLFLFARLASTGVAVALLAAQDGTDHDTLLAGLGLGWGAATALAAWQRPALLRRPSAWAVDGAVALALVLGTEDWRSPFFLFALTTLAAPSAMLALRPALAWGATFTAAYAVIAVICGVDLAELRTSARLDTLATHVLLPVVVTGGVAFGADALRRLAEARREAERLAVEGERRRIAWELHDSAKQRLHAAALMLSTVDGEATPMVGDALQEVQGAVADMETAIAELRSPLESRALADALRQHASELQRLNPVAIHVAGAAPALPDVTATHVYRIVAEAMANAVRHAQATTVDVRLDGAGGGVRATVLDDGRGLPPVVRPGAGGLLTMRSRAFAIGGRLTVGRGPGDRGTRIDLELPAGG